MKNVLVTGGAGFIGSNLCKKLHDFGFKVVSIDDYSTGSEKNHVSGVSYLKMKTEDIFTLSAMGFTPNLIYHLGEYSRVEQSFDDILKVTDSNTIGTRAVVDYALSTKAKLIYAGSSTKFGDNGPNSSPYAFTKSQNTELVKNYGDWFGLKYAITYFYNVVGKNEIAEGRYATVLAKFLNRHKRGLPLQVTGDGSQLRNFTHVEDIVNGLILVGMDGFGDGYGLGNDKAYSILEIAQLISNNIQFMPQQRGNRNSATLDVEKSRSLGWSATHDIKQYISDQLSII